MGQRVRIVRRPSWRWWVTPKPLYDKPLHRWCVFPHSFTSELVHGLIDEWDLDDKDRVLDPFCGAGTTVLAARERGIPATGYDLSPFSVLAARVKVANHDSDRLAARADRLVRDFVATERNGASRDYPALVVRALPGQLLGAFECLATSIDRVTHRPDRDFFRLALLSLIPVYSRAAVTGGWLKWSATGTRASSLATVFRRRVAEMLEDIPNRTQPVRNWRIGRADARALPEDGRRYSAVITSPPYPNRHDYTRVFGVELMFGFVTWEGARRIRHQSFHSHPEARPRRPRANGYEAPHALSRALERIRSRKHDPRVVRMLDGYFLDSYLALREIRKVTKTGARVAWIVGNAQYYGVQIPVDELTTEVGRQAGLTPERVIAVRYRGNSAQQMGKYGRRESRESVVVFRRN